jgi:hypothetical protein
MKVLGTISDTSHDGMDLAVVDSRGPVGVIKRARRLRCTPASIEGNNSLAGVGSLPR